MTTDKESGGFKTAVLKLVLCHFLSCPEFNAVLSLKSVMKKLFLTFREKVLNGMLQSMVLIEVWALVRRTRHPVRIILLSNFSCHPIMVQQIF